ncbi:MAG: HAMP domain-containing sensor histidine kinase [bacterium]|nr:HAMP domain-containing sensor histidine kinase [bacterium]
MEIKKLSNKIFYTLILILSISILTVVGIFNIQNYYEQKKSINNSLNVSMTKKDRKVIPPTKIDDASEPVDDVTHNTEDMRNRNIKFMDSVIYTILLDDNNNILEVINHSNNETSSEKISSIAKKILSNKNIKDRYIGNLYLSDYSYAYSKGDTLIILDNSKIKSSLLLSLEVSLFIFIILEILVIVLSRYLTIWIIKPVKESFSKQKQFIADASHELKTPLSVIVASSEAIDITNQNSKWLKNIEYEANRMNLLISKLLDLAKSERMEEIVLVNNNLSKAVELSLLTFEGRAFEKDIKLSYEIEDNINILMDEDSIKELVEILLDNAIKHSKKNGNIKVSLKKDSQVTLLVQNEGEPIPKGEEEKIFERFYRVDKSRNRKDNRYGLGLAIAKNIVLSHKGKIKASSLDGVTTFEVTLKNNK